MQNSTRLLVAEFLDSERGRELASGGVEPVRRAAELIAGSAFDDLGTHPRLLDGEQARALLLERVARRIGAKDPLLEQIPEVARALFALVAETSLAPNAFEVEVELAGIDDAFQAAARAEGGRIAGDVETLRNRTAKLSRNDPCPCGSGKKFKKCCMNRGG